MNMKMEKKGVNIYATPFFFGNTEKPVIILDPLEGRTGLVDLKGKRWGEQL